MHQIIEHGIVGQAMAQKILADVVNGPDNPFPQDVKGQAQAMRKQTALTA